METLEYQGQYNGWPVTYRRQYDDPTQPITADELQGATAWLESNGIKPLGTPPVMPDNRGSYAPPAQQQAPQPAPQQNYGGGWQCPIHGAQKIKPGYQNRGWECGVTTNNVPAYRHRAWNGRNGMAYTCDEKSS